MDVLILWAGYNAGEGAVIRYGQTIPPYRETQDYVRLINQALPRKTEAGIEWSRQQE